jgi:hypothetical protein
MTAPLLIQVDPQRFAEWLGHGMSPGLVTRMLSYPRLNQRCQDLIEGRLGPVSPSDVQGSVLSLNSSGLARLTLHAGSIWHAANIAQVIEGSAVRDLIAAIGGDLRLFAVQNLALAPPIPIGSHDALPDALKLDGARCLVAWCRAQPPAIGMRVTLRLTQRVTPQEQHQIYGPPLVETLLNRDMWVS